MTDRKKKRLLRSASKCLRGKEPRVIPGWALVAALSGRLRWLVD